MKKAVLILSAISSIAAAKTNYSRGFCVPADKDLARPNAVVVITENSIGNQPIAPGDHRFFDFDNGEKKLSGITWATVSNVIVRSAERIPDQGNLAIYLDSAHFSASPPVLVRCIADDIAEKLDQVLSVEGTAKACVDVIEMATHEAKAKASSVCKGIDAGLRLKMVGTPTVIKAENRGCWVGSDATVKIDFQCH